MSAQPATKPMPTPRERLIAACDTDAVPADVRRTILRMRVERAARGNFAEYLKRMAL